MGDSQMRIGAFFNTLISFVTIAAAIFFMVVKPAARLQAITASQAEDEEAGPSEIDLLTEIRDELRNSAA